MASLDIIDKDSKKVDTVNLSDDVFGLDVKPALLHASVVNYLANQRQGTHATKTRGMVRGGGKKPWKQKHTGRARAGSGRSPLWRGGAIVFGPQPRDYSYRINRKERRLALRNALSQRVAEQHFVIVDTISFEKPRTKGMVDLLGALGISGKSVLVLTAEKDVNVYLSSRNIPGVSVLSAADTNTYAIMAHEYVLATRDAVLSLQEGLLK